MESIEQLLIDGQFEEVRKKANELLQNKQWMEAYDLTQAYIAYGFFEEAVSMYRALRAALPDMEQLKVDEAQVLIELGDEDGALLLLEQVDKEDDVYLQVLLIEADYYGMLGMTEVAMQKVNEAYRRAPEEPIIQFAYAETALAIGNNREAIRMYETLQEAGHETIGQVSIVQRLAEAHRAGGAYEEATSYFEQVIEEEATPDDLLDMAYVQVQSGHPERAIQPLERILEMDPDYFSAYYLLGHAHSLLEQNEEAYEVYEAGVRRDAFNKELHHAAGKVALKLQKEDEAVRHFEEALVLDPEYTESLLTLAAIYERREDDEALIELLTAPHVLLTPDLSFMLAKAYNREELYEEAGKAFDEAAPYLEDDPIFLRAYASFLREDGQIDRAIKVAKRLIALEPNEWEWVNWLEDRS